MSSSERAHVQVDRNVCVGSGTCVMVDPDHFELVDGKAQAVQGPLEVTEELGDAILDCPVRAIERSDA